MIGDDKLDKNIRKNNTDFVKFRAKAIAKHNFRLMQRHLLKVFLFLSLFFII